MTAQKQAPSSKASPDKSKTRKRPATPVVSAKTTAKDTPKVPHNVTPEELTPDGTVLLAFTIPGRPMTKKTHQRIVRRGGFNRILPSKEYEQYEIAAQVPCEAAWKNLGKSPMDFGVGVTLKVYLNNWVIGDETGYMQSIGDILEKWGVIANDKFIHWLPEGHMISAAPEKDAPRVEITLTRYRHPYETYRAEQEAAEARRQERARQKTLVASPTQGETHV